jgi:uncharacterized damage-inducible protein DinB
MNAAQFFDHWNKIWRDLQRAVSMLKDEHLDFRPAERYHRSVGDILLHIIEIEQFWIHDVIQKGSSSLSDEDKGQLRTVAEIQEEMEAVHKRTMDFLTTVPVEDFNRIVQVPQDGTPKLGWILWHIFEQQIHHRGELYLCLSLLGMDRPKTDRPG